MKILLAPMEGVVDPVTRELYSQIGGIDYCVTEFVRVTSLLLPPKVFYRYCPELKTNSRTSTDVPVFVQLLGSDLNAMAENAQRAIELGAYGIDINFGCPAKTVNRHDGGAALLKNPERVFQVANSIRKAVPKEKPVTVKVRLGFEDKSLCNEIARAAQEANAHWLTVHARTKVEAYKPPAHWEYIAQMKEQVSIPVIANGDLWSPEDYERCKEITGCDSYMLGRGLIARPSLARELKTNEQLWDFAKILPLVKTFIVESKNHRDDRYATQRTKQWIKLLSRTYPEARELFENIKRLSNTEDILRRLSLPTPFPVQMLKKFSRIHQIPPRTYSESVQGTACNPM